MLHADAAVVAAHANAPSSRRFEQAGLIAVFGVAATLQFSIAAAQALLAIAVTCWLALVVWRREPIDVPRFFWPLVALAVLTLISAAFSPQPRVSFADTKQLVLFLIVPLTYRLVTGNRGVTMTTVMVSVGAASAAFGIFQYGILHYDNLGLRPRGTLGHWMTYSGLLMLVMGVALARILFGKSDRMWAALVMPALAVAVALTFTRSAWVGACAGAALLLALKDLRLIAVLPIVAAAFFAVAPTTITERFMSIFDRNNPTNRDRVAMLREGKQMIGARPLVGVGPNMVEVLYADYRDQGAVEQVNPHLHNVPLQIAAERGLPALAVWIWFVVVVLIDLTRVFRAGQHRMLAAAALAAMVAMPAAGMFEYNFGDSEFLMLFLVLVTLPYAADRNAGLP
jgi:O-antigen ligase